MVPSAHDLATAFAATRRLTVRTPLLESPGLAEATGAARVFVKAECLQRAGSFKIRGATWRLMQLSDAERARGVVAYSSGNFAQGLAAAGKAAGVPVTIVMPDDAPEMKRRATEGFGARVVLSHHGDRPREEVASALARELSQTEGLVLLHPFDDPAIVAGQAAVGLEAQVPSPRSTIRTKRARRSPRSARVRAWALASSGDWSGRPKMRSVETRRPGTRSAARTASRAPSGSWSRPKNFRAAASSDWVPIESLPTP